MLTCVFHAKRKGFVNNRAVGACLLTIPPYTHIPKAAINNRRRGQLWAPNFDTCIVI
jgi:hypothetical protein